jgi:hypothetical protein
MKNKPKDEFYCNVSEERIKKSCPKLKLENVKLLCEWISERYEIHLKKDIKKQKKPWTENKILKKYKFCNVRREQDRESRWLIKNIAKNKNLSYENKILNTILFRLINKSETTEMFGLLNFEEINYKKIKGQLDLSKKQNPKYVFFSNAFFTSGQKNAAKKLFSKEKNQIIRIIKLTEHYKKQKIIEKIKEAKNQKQIFEELKNLPGIGIFLAYQIFVDFTYMKKFPFSENEFVIAGPGCKKGLKLIFQNADKMSDEECLFWLRNNQNKLFKRFGYFPKKLFSDLPKFDRYLNVMSLENCMCEFSKYYRALKNQGRPRIRYFG